MSGQLATISYVIQHTAMSKATKNLPKLARKLHTSNNYDRPPFLSVLTELAGE